MTILFALALFALVVAVHAVALRAFRGDAVTKFALIGGLGGVALLGNAILSAGALDSVAAVAAYAFACELYLFLFASIGTSVSVRILLTLRDAPRRVAELEKLYAADGMVQARFEKLRGVGLLDAADRLTPRGRLLASIFQGLRTFFRHVPPAPAARSRPSRQPAGIA